jgi:hypothetical protein
VLSCRKVQVNAAASHKEEQDEGVNRRRSTRELEPERRITEYRSGENPDQTAGDRVCCPFLDEGDDELHCDGCGRWGENERSESARGALVVLREWDGG